MRDFQAAPRFGLVFGAVYAAGGLVIVLSVTAFGMTYLAYPLATASRSSDHSWRRGSTR